jgi:hypothetical protein
MQPARVVVFLGALLLALSLTAQPVTRVRIDPTSGNVTLNARNVPLSTILAGLAAEGTEVIVPELADRPVTISVQNRPLAAVLRQILPAGTRYWIRGRQDDRAVAGSTGDKPGRVTQRPANLPKKDGNVTLPPIDPAGTRKPPAEERLPRPRRVAGMKEPPAIRDGDERPGPKIARKTETQGRYVRIRLTMTKEKVLFEEGLVLESELIPDRRLLGTFVWALESQGQILAVGSFQDPLELHSYFPDPREPHAVLEAASGEFHISLPSSVLDGDRLAGSRLVIYRVLAEPPTQELTPETFPKFAGVLREQYTVSGAELYRALREQQ